MSGCKATDILHSENKQYLIWRDNLKPEEINPGVAVVRKWEIINESLTALKCTQHMESAEN